MAMRRPKIHWRKYLTRKVIILAVFAVAGYAAEHYLRLWFAGKGAELALGTVLEHTFFEVPMEEA
jgi:hypothetical protein